MARLFPVLIIRRGSKPLSTKGVGPSIGFRVDQSVRHSGSSFGIDIPDPRLQRLGEMMQDPHVPLGDLVSEHANVLNSAATDDDRRHLRCLMTDMMADFMAIIEERRRPHLFRGPRMPKSFDEAVEALKQALRHGSAEQIARLKREVKKFGGDSELLGDLALEAL